jgi:N-acetylmuramoyl-L-alanine amidase
MVQTRAAPRALRKGFFLLVAGLLLTASLFSLSIDQTLGTLGPGVRFRYDPLLETGAFSLKSTGGTAHEAIFQAGNAYLLLDYSKVYMVEPPVLNNGVLDFPSGFVTTLKAVLEMKPGAATPPPSPAAVSATAPASAPPSGSAAQSTLPHYKVAAIIIDPGHGGKDNGASGTFIKDGKPVVVKEKDIVLEVGKRLYNKLKTAYPKKLLLMTRTSDTFPTLEDRTKVANSVQLNDNQAIIYIAIHANASLNAKAKGFEVWILPHDYQRELVDPSDYPNNPEVVPIFNDMLQDEYFNESVKMAQDIEKGYAAALPEIPDRGMKEQDWYVVRNSRMPAVLVELGFVTNQEDADMMTSTSGLQKMTTGLYNGIVNFIKDFEGED